MGQVDSVAEKHEKPYQYQGRCKHDFAPSADFALDIEGVDAATQQVNEDRAQDGISQYAPQSVEQAVEEHHVPLLDVLADVTHGSDIGGERTRTEGVDDAQKESGQHGDVTAVEE